MTNAANLVPSVKEAEANAIKQAAVLRLFKQFKDNIQAIDEPGFNAVRALTAGQAFQYLCKRYGVPPELVWALPQENMSTLLIHVATLYANETPLCEVPESAKYKKIVAGSSEIPAYCMGLRAEVLAESVAGFSLVKVFRSKNTVVGVALVHTRTLADINAKTRCIDMED